MADKIVPCRKEWNIATLEANQSNMGRDIAQILETLKSMDEKLEKNYAAKWVEKVIVFSGSVIWTILIGSVMYLIINQR